MQSRPKQMRPTNARVPIRYTTTVKRPWWLQVIREVEFSCIAVMRGVDLSCCLFCHEAELQIRSIDRDQPTALLESVKVCFGRHPAVDLQGKAEFRLVHRKTRLSWDEVRKRGIVISPWPPSSMINDPADSELLHVQRNLLVLGSSISHWSSIYMYMFCQLFI